jgi:hypothetical protein
MIWQVEIEVETGQIAVLLFFISSIWKAGNIKPLQRGWGAAAA